MGELLPGTPLHALGPFTGAAAARLPAAAVPDRQGAGAGSGVAKIAARPHVALEKRPRAPTFTTLPEGASRVPRAPIVARLLMRRDILSGVAWYLHPSQPAASNPRSTVFVYIGRKRRGAPWLRMRVVLAAAPSSALERVEARFDGDGVTLYDGPFNERRTAARAVWGDARTSPAQLRVLRSIAEAENAVLRFHGADDHHDVPLSDDDQKALRDMLGAFEALGG